MKKASRKLDLRRETLQPLQPGALDDVDGGTNPAISASVVIATMRFCVPASRVVSALSVPVANSVSKAWDWLTHR